MNQEQRETIERIKSAANRNIWVTFQKAGFHKYPAASIDPALEDVSYLGNRHRHLFKFNIQIEIFHNDREIEFHQCLNYCDKGNIDTEISTHTAVRICKILGAVLDKFLTEKG